MSAERPALAVKAFDRRMISVASVTVLGSIMSVLDTTIVNVALNTLVRAFHTSFANIQWVSTGYLLSIALVIPLTRWMIDRFGTKRVWMTSISLFLVGSLLCGLAWSAPVLVIFRVLQGFGGGMIMPVGQTILARESGPERMGRVMSVVGVPQLLGPMLGPVVGGVILSHLSWRWIFFVNLPIGAVALIRSRKVLERNDSDLVTAHRFDFTGLLLLSPGLALFVYGLSEFGNHGRFTVAVVLGVSLGVALIVAFLLHARRATHPLLDLRLWKTRGFARANLVIFLFGGAMTGGTFLAPLYYQVDRGASPLLAAVLMASGGLGGMIGMTIGGRISDRSGPRRIVPIALVVLSVGFLPFTQVTAHTSLFFLSMCWLVRGIGAGSASAPTNAASYMVFERAQIPGATALNTIGMQVGGSLAVASAAVLLQRRLVSQLGARVAGDLSHLGPAQRLREAPAIAHAFGLVFWVMVILSLLAVLPALQLPTKRKLSLLEEVEVGEGQQIGVLAAE